MKFTKFIFFAVLLFSANSFSMFRLTSVLKNLSSNKSKINPMTILGISSAAATCYIYYKKQEQLKKYPRTEKEKHKMLVNTALRQDLRIFNEIESTKNKQK